MPDPRRMALRSRSRTAVPTSGPGRGPASDVRSRHRRRPPTTGRRGRHRYASGEELRRRAEVIFPERVEEWRELGADAPDPTPSPDRAPSPVLSPTVLDPSSSPAPASGDWRVRVGLAVRERMPVWLQTRCGLERRSVVALTVLLVVAAGFAVQHFWTGRTQSVRAPEVVRAAVPFEGERASEEQRTEAGGGAGAAGAASAEIVVDVSGKVREPGIHRLPAGSRVADALRAAGGVKSGADTTGLNRARFLIDGEQIVVGSPAGAAPGPAGAAGGAAGASDSVGSGGSVAGAGPAAPVSLNTATVDQLDTLPGVGPVLAQHIVDYRTQHAGFRSVDELREVNGIGERRFADLRNLVRP
ncbi:MAG: ComEA family DNA-binding protein [Streptomyces sp.]|nr:ComEA family DNA-binding protein [Streptomyces sp.]